MPMMSCEEDYAVSINMYGFWGDIPEAFYNEIREAFKQERVEKFVLWDRDTNEKIFEIMRSEWLWRAILTSYDQNSPLHLRNYPLLYIF